MSDQFSDARCSFKDEHGHQCFKRALIDGPRCHGHEHSAIALRVEHPGICNKEFLYEGFCGLNKGHAGECDFQ